MQPAPIPPDEATRIAALRALAILDSPPEERFERITRLAAALFDCPIALISLVDTNRQWFKACIGLDTRQTPRDISFCGHAILHEDAFVIPDARADARFSDNPLVTSAPAIRFYAGQPLKSPGGERIGTLCVIDRAPRQPTTAQLERLRDLAALAENELGQLELREALATRDACEVALDRHSRTLDTILHLTPDAFVAFDRNGKRNYANRALATLVGPAVAARRTLASFDRALAAASRLPAGRRQPRDGETDLAELEIDANGQRRILQRMDRAIEGANGSPEGRIVFLRDITHEYEVDRMKTEFISIAAHELRTPMASIHGFAELLLKRDYDAETRRDLLATIYRQSTNLTHLVNELLDIARIEARAGADFKIAPHALDTILAQAVETAAPPDQAERVRCHVPPRLPAVRVDSEKFCQAVVNVITNALKYSPVDSAVEISVTGPTSDEPTMLGVLVQDSGIGMSPEEQRRIFERFYRAGQTGDAPGAGLGMSLVKDIMELLGGRVDIDSRQGDGTTVTLWIPTETH